MDVTRLPHRWDLEPRAAAGLQAELARSVRSEPYPGRPRLLAGCDAAFLADPPRCVAGVVVWDSFRRALVAESSFVAAVDFPYIPGLLSFREAPALLEAIRRLEIDPDVFVFDGQGIAHPRRLGLAAHVGLLIDRPSLGVGKSRLVGEHREPGPRRGASTQLWHAGAVVGRVLRTRDGVKPVYVSPGHRMDVSGAARIALAAAVGYRIPEPTRQADILVARRKREILGEG